MTAPDLEQACAPDTASLREVMQVIDRHASSLCVLVDDERRRRRRASPTATSAGPSSPARPSTTRRCRTRRRAPTSSARARPARLVLDLMRALRISAVPEVDADSRIVRLHTLSDVVGTERLPNVAVVMAGGPGYPARAS